MDLYLYPDCHSDAVIKWRPSDSPCMHETTSVPLAYKNVHGLILGTDLFKGLGLGNII